MIESIHIKNLGPIKDISIDHIKPLTVLIGESGSGKSTLMKAIALFRWIYKMHNIRSYLKHSNISKSPFRFRMETYFKNCGFEQFITEKTEIKYNLKFKSGNSYSIEYKQNKLNGTGSSDLIKEADLYFNKVSFISETRNIIPIWSEKGSSSGGMSLGFYFNELFADFYLASEAIKELELKFLNLKFAVKQTKLGKKYTIKSTSDDAFDIDFKNSSSGTQNSVPLLLITQYFSKNFSFEDAFNRSVLTYLSSTNDLTSFKAIKNLSEINKKIYIHIEEPELSLYPDAQNKLISDLIEKCFIGNGNPIELFFSTHSPYVINHLNLLIKAFDKNKLVDGAKIRYENLAVYQVSGGKLENLMVQNQRLVNTNPLSETINETYDQYNAL
ncbi:AAA family ATPase [Myroides sp. DW712]|uniref:AAA family ATPase n=1 Tax=Myroides sp. DW712 TaxID=3389800 RepID=UPI00397C07F7